jgi:hypothetical protein
MDIKKKWRCHLFLTLSLHRSWTGGTCGYYEKRFESITRVWVNEQWELDDWKKKAQG